MSECLETAAKKAENFSKDEFFKEWQDRLDKAGQIFCSHDFDATKKRKEIEIFLSSGDALFCSVDRSKNLKCFGLSHKKQSPKDNAFIANCKFTIESSENLDDSNELKKFLREEFEKKEKAGISSETKSPKNPHIELVYESNTKDTIDKEATWKNLGDKFRDLTGYIHLEYGSARSGEFQFLIQKFNEFKYSDKDAEFLDKLKDYYENLEQILFSSLEDMSLDGIPKDAIIERWGYGQELKKAYESIRKKYIFSKTDS